MTMGSLTLIIGIVTGLLVLVLAGGGLAVAAVVFTIVLRKDRHTAGPGGRARRKDRGAAIRAATRRLAQDPKDAEALLELAGIAYEEQDYGAAAGHYRALIDLCATNPELDEFTISVRYAVSALHIKAYEEAYRNLMVASTMNGDDFDVNYHLGYLEYARKQYDRSVALLQKARNVNPDHLPTTRYLGHALYRTHRYAEAVGSLTVTFQNAPGDKDTLFALGHSCYQVGDRERAARIFAHLRGEPRLGPRASLFAGIMHANARLYAKAIEDFDIGLRHDKIPTSVALELKYGLAGVCLKVQDIERAVRLLGEILQVNPEYKDVREQSARYQELASNKLLKTYLMAASSEFVGLCRRIAVSHIQDAVSKPVDISIRQNEHVDVLCTVRARRWEDLVLFRFVRTAGDVGDMVLREMYGRIREVKAGRGYCFAAGCFSEAARRFVEARLVDLVEKDGLLKVFSRLAGG